MPSPGSRHGRRGRKHPPPCARAAIIPGDNYCASFPHTAEGWVRGARGMSRGDARRQPGQPPSQPGWQPSIPPSHPRRCGVRAASRSQSSPSPSGLSWGTPQRLPWEGEEDRSPEPSSPARRTAGCAQELPGADLHHQQDRQELPATRQRRGEGEEGEPSCRLCSRWDSSHGSSLALPLGVRAGCSLHPK